MDPGSSGAGLVDRKPRGGPNGAGLHITYAVERKQSEFHDLVSIHKERSLAWGAFILTEDCA